MTPLQILQDPQVPPSVVWAVVEKLMGKEALAYEPDTLRIELTRRGASWDAIAPKVLGAQTIQVTRVWVWDHDALFAFALACDGLHADPELVHHPEIAAVAWAVDEIAELVGSPMTDERGFDPDTIDPAIAVLLHDEGWVVAPEPLCFVQEDLDRLNHHQTPLRDQVQAAWLLPDPPVDETPRGVQLARLSDVATERAARIQHRANLREHLR